MTQDQGNLGNRQTMVKNRFVIIIEVKATHILILFLAKRKQTSQNNDIRFSIVKIITSSNNLDVKYISLNNKLKKICDGNSHSKLQQIGRGDSDRGGSSIEKRAGDRNRQAKQQGSERRRVSKKPRFLSK